MSENGELDAEIGGQKVSLKGVNLQTLGVLGTFALVLLIAYGGFQHMQETREATASFVSALKEQTQASREQTQVMKEQVCMLRFDQKDRGLQQNVDFCKQMSR